MPSDKPAWKALLARISIFPLTPSPTPPSALDLFRRVWDVEPEEFHGQTNPLMPSMAQGRVGSIIANCSKQQLRTDFHLLPLPVGASLALIEDTTQLHGELSRIIRVIGEGLIPHPVTRVAVFLQFVIPASTSADANRILLESMPQAYRMRVTDEEDFVFQVNRPVNLNIMDSIRMNLIAKWSVEHIQLFAGRYTPPVSQPVITASITFDHNNAPIIIPIGTDRQAALLNEGLSRVASLRHDFDMNITGF